MTHNLVTIPTQPVSLGKRMLIGGGIALVLIALFLIPIKHTNPEWGKFWMVRPFIIVPLAGAVGGAVSYYLNIIGTQRGWYKLAIIAFSLIVYIVGLWMGTVLGLVGTLWN